MRQLGERTIEVPRRGCTFHCVRCGVTIPLAAGPSTTCPRCASDQDAAERIADALLAAANAAASSLEAHELSAMALAWYSTLPDVA